jgi:hypothetical protein
MIIYCSYKSVFAKEITSQIHRKQSDNTSRYFVKYSQKNIINKMFIDINDESTLHTTFRGIHVKWGIDKNQAET